MPLQMIFHTIRDNHLFLDKTKCAFSLPRVEYLGYLITKVGVFTEPQKIHVVNSWPLPNTIRQSRGLLGLARY